MKFEPNELPFWEQRRGDGPLTKLLKRREKLAHKLRRQDTVESLRTQIDLLVHNQKAMRRRDSNWGRAQEQIDVAKAKLKKLGTEYEPKKLNLLPLKEQEELDYSPDFTKAILRVFGNDGNGNRWRRAKF